MHSVPKKIKKIYQIHFLLCGPKSNEFVNPVEIYEGSIILSHPWATIPWPPGTFQPPTLSDPSAKVTPKCW